MSECTKLKDIEIEVISSLHTTYSPILLSQVYKMLSFIYIPITITVILVFVNTAEGTNGNSPNNIEWKALVGSFASSDSSSESTSSSSRQPPTKKTQISRINTTMTKPHELLMQTYQTLEELKKAKNKKRYLRRKSDPEKFKRYQERDRIRYLKNKAQEQEMLDKLPEYEKDAYMKAKTQKRTMENRMFRKKKWEKLGKLPIEQQEKEIGRIKRKRSSENYTYRMKKKNEEQKD